MRGAGVEVETGTSQDSELQPGPMRGPPAPVFIVGMNGSGTTMMLDCLNNHPELYGFPLETKILPLYMQREAQYGNLRHDENFLRLWDDLRNIVFFRIVNGRRPPPLPHDWAERERTFAGALDGVFRHFAECEGKTRWCEKSPMYALHIEAFAAMYPHARFIHMIRDGRDCAHSFQRRYGFSPPRSMLRWKTVVQRARNAGRAIGHRYMEVRYEDLTDAPETHMRRVCSFLGIPYSEAMLSLSRERRQDKMVASRIVPNSERWREGFSPRQCRQLERIGGQLLMELGYETTLPDSDWTPSVLLQGYWRHHDNFRSALREFRDLSRAETWRHRRLILEKAVANVRNRISLGA